MNASIVAIFGLIIPEPLLIPVTRILLSSITPEVDTALGIVSVVIIASAASSQLSAFKLSTKKGIDSFILSIGK